jgi:hypothetical protein
VADGRKNSTRLNEIISNFCKALVAFWKFIFLKQNEDEFAFFNVAVNWSLFVWQRH